jgi:hypothetical protein
VRAPSGPTRLERVEEGELALLVLGKVPAAVVVLDGEAQIPVAPLLAEELDGEPLIDQRLHDLRISGKSAYLRRWLPVPAGSARLEPMS